MKDENRTGNVEDEGATWGSGVDLPSGAMVPYGFAVDAEGNFLVTGDRKVYTSVDQGQTWDACVDVLRRLGDGSSGRAE